MSLSGDCREERSRVSPPTPILSLVIGYQGSGKLFNVVCALDFREQIPFHRALIEGIEHHVAAIRAVESLQDIRRPGRRSRRGRLAPVPCQNFPYRRTFAGACRADQFEMLGFISCGNCHAGQSELRISCISAGLRFRRCGPLRDEGSSLMRFVCRWRHAGDLCRPRNPALRSQPVPTASCAQLWNSSPKCLSKAFPIAMPSAAVAVNGSATTGETR